ncbi:chorismate mutase [Pseudodesulfovibrio sp. F-1]|uniref:Chorismate mutase n=1 Tax=Pseudodesulfovibrio alkaliphilus TaxID=2661613 RepID=A0A7K1KKU0_9BACT|nr:chorismate mutase [Pseudodesulfovibrio alkaliphilus]MUM76685.1 chorismate mutase [Pseudodesulfovibrio alkaliphilus]
MIKIRKEDTGRTPVGKGSGRGGRPARGEGPVKFGKRPPRPTRDTDQDGEDAPFADKAADVAQHRFTDISQIDGQILHLLEKRSFLIRKEGAWRKSRQKSLVDPKLEKLLRTAFDQAASDLGLDARLTRTLFTLLNQFSLADVRKKFTGEGYKLAPRQEPVQAAITGPRSFRRTRMMLAMAASAGLRTTLAPVTMNAPNKDLAKALKQVGAPIHWDEDFIRNDGGRTLGFEGAMVFVGEDSFNFYLLLALALGHAGRCKFTGKPGLQLMDIASLNKVLPNLGARLVPMNPNNPGLPARLECGGAMDEEITLPGSLDPDFAAALTLAAWTYPGGLTIRGLGPEARERVAEAVDVLAVCGIQASLSGDTVTVNDGVPVMEEVPTIPLSVSLCGLLLALPIMTGGSINIQGTWPSSERGRRVLDELSRLGLRIDTATDNLIATKVADMPRGAAIALGSDPDLLPLALALALKGEDAVLKNADDTVMELLDRMGAAYEQTDDGLALKPGGRTWEGTWYSPAPTWSMGCALAAYAVPGIVLENHGEVTSTWPEFWNFYNSLPTGKMKPKPATEKKDDTRRRIKIR